MDYLSVIPADGRTFRHEIAVESMRIGRSSGNDLVLDDPNVSRVHAQIVRRPEGYYVLDAGGKNGTFANEEKIAGPTLLRPGDRVRIGTTTLIFNGTPASRVELTDQPLLGPSTTILGPQDLLTPGAPDIPLVLDSMPTPRPDLTRTPTLRRTPSPHPGAVTPARIPPEALSIILEADTELVFHRPLSEILDRIMDLAHRVTPYERGVLMLLHGDHLEPHVVRVPQDEAGGTISLSRTVTERVIKHQESLLVSDAQVDDRFREGVSVAAQRLRSVMCVPLWDNRQVIGLIYVDSRVRPGLFREDELRLLTHLANVAAVKIENARLFEQAIAAETMTQELQKAAEIQNHLLPQGGPVLDGYLLDGTSLPCRAVGGDYYDYLPLSGGRLAFGVGDIAGKGLPAALLMCCFQATLRALTDIELSPVETIARLNRLLCHRLPSNRFVTFFYGILDPANHELIYLNAGHNPPWILRPDGSRQSLDIGGPPLGMLDTASCRADRIALRPGDLLICFSDGATEALNATGEEFGEERLLQCVEAARGAPPLEIIRRVGEAVAGHHGGPALADDLTLLILKRTA